MKGIGADCGNEDLCLLIAYFLSSKRIYELYFREGRRSEVIQMLFVFLEERSFQITRRKLNAFRKMYIFFK